MLSRGIKTAVVIVLSVAALITPQTGNAQKDERSGEEVVAAVCAACHGKDGAGVESAPKIGDQAAWIPRLSRGLDFLVRSAIHGHRLMPPRGGMAALTNPEIRAAILYMFNPKGVPAKAPSAALPATTDPAHKIVDGTEIYLGIVAAETIRAQRRKGDEESKMHGGIPRGTGYYHVNISLFDSRTRAVITDARVEAKVAEPVAGGEAKRLELVTFNNMPSYGNYFRMSSKNPYTITVQIRRPGTSRPIDAKFEVKHY